MSAVASSDTKIRTMQERRDLHEISGNSRECVHCGQQIPTARTTADFCCAGCEAVYGLIHGQALDRFYALGGGANHPVGRVPQVSKFDWLADLIEQAARPHASVDGSIGRRVRLRLDVQGIHCAACVWVIQELWRRQPGGLRIHLNPALGQMDLDYDRDRLDVASFLATIEAIGYRVAPPSKRSDHGTRTLLLRLGICAALAMNAMMFSFAGYFGMTEADGSTYWLFTWISFGICTLALLVGGPVFFRSALGGLRRAVLHLDLPISVGLILAYAGSTYSFFAAGDSRSYFDTVTIFVTLMLVGRYLQERSIEKNRLYLLANDGADHLRSKRVVGEGVEQVPVRDIRAGDTILLSPGDLVPADALTQAGGLFSLDWIEGESEPRWIDAGQPVTAGAFLRGQAPARVVTTRSAAESGLCDRLATPARPDERGSSRFWDMVNRRYVALVLIFATIGLVAWAFVDPHRAIDVAVAILVVTCPCALGIATPLAVEITLAALRRSGVYVRNVRLLDRARAIKKVVFDKTGTLTWGETEARIVRPVAGPWRDVLMTMVNSSNHPVSQAVAKACANGPFTFLADLEMEEMVGRGLRAMWQGHEYRLGSHSYVFGDAGHGGNDDLCIFARDGHVEACFQIEEDVRHGFRQEIRDLGKGGMKVFLLSGDRPHKVARVAELLEIPPESAFGNQRPEQKRAFVQALDQDDTLMVGDGLNDAPAFDVAWCSGAAALDRPAMPARADFFFLGAGAASVSRVVAASRQLYRVIKANLWLAAAYNGIALTLAFAGAMTPLLCAVLMPLSSLGLIAHTAYRLRATGALA